MKTVDWNAIGRNYSAVQDARRDTVFTFLLSRLMASKPSRLLDFGAGDGVFAASCASLGIKSIVAYDPSTNMVELARRNCDMIPEIEVTQSIDQLPRALFDTVTMNAVWMCLNTPLICLQVLSDIHSLLCEGGVLIASVTHPCFRNYKYSSFETDFDPANYLHDGTQFNVRIFDGVREVQIVDTHWSLGEMSRQLKESCFVIEEISEVSESAVTHCGVPWMVIFAKKQAPLQLVSGRCPSRS